MTMCDTWHCENEATDEWYGTPVCIDCLIDLEYMATCERCGTFEHTHVQTSAMTGEASYHCTQCGGIWM